MSNDALKRFAAKRYPNPNSGIESDGFIRPPDIHIPEQEEPTAKLAPSSPPSQKNVRIAVCFHGQLRNACHAAPAIKAYLGDLWENCDFFIHTWNINTYTSPCESFKDYIYALTGTEIDLNLTGPPVKKSVTYDEVEFVKFFYQPKFFKVESYEKWAEEHSSSIKKALELIIPAHCPPYYYSFFSSIQGKKSFENENGFIYDAVVKLRPDVSFLVNKMPIYKDKKCHLASKCTTDVYTSYLCHDLITFYKDTTSFYKVGEELWISTSLLMDRVSNIWQDFKFGNTENLSIAEYLTKHHIQQKTTHTVNVAFHRAICQIVPSTDWPLVHLLSVLTDQVGLTNIVVIIEDDVKNRLINYIKSDDFLDMLQQTYESYNRRKLSYQS